MTLTARELFMDLDRLSPIPLYYQMAKRMQDAIQSGRLPAGSRIENELQIAVDLGISRPTVRRAIRELVDQGLLVRRRGVGTQVVRGQVRRNIEFTSLYDALSAAGRSPSTKILTHEAVEPSPEILDSLALPPGTTVLHVIRVRSADGVPFALLDNYLPPEFLDLTAEQMRKHGLYQLMRARGTTLRVAHQTIGARSCRKDEGKHLGLKAGAPVLTMRRVFFDQSGHPVELGFHCYRPDLYAFDMTVVDK